ncbi:MAG TPA: hypothetical protein PL033_00700 [Candidatus Brocadiia bacterium]|nr:hypothetical protein [Candidatus Brocadiia bacterium]
MRKALLILAVICFTAAGILMAQSAKPPKKGAELPPEDQQTYHTLNPGDLAVNFSQYRGRRVALLDQFKVVERRIFPMDEINPRDYYAFSTYSDLTICIERKNEALLKFAETLARSENITIRGKVIGERPPYKYIVAETIVRGHADNPLSTEIGAEPEIEVYIDLDGGGKKKLLGSGKYNLKSPDDEKAHTLEVLVMINGKKWVAKEE